MGEIVSIFREVPDELFGVVSRAAGGLQDERDRADVWTSFKFDLLSSLGCVTWAGAACNNENWAAVERSHHGNIEVRDGAVVIKNEVHARVFHLSVHHMSESWNRLLDVHLSAVVCVSRLLGIWPLRHACGEHHLHTGSHSNGAVARSPVCHKVDPLHVALRGQRLRGGATQVSWHRHTKTAVLSVKVRCCKRYAMCASKAM